MRRQPYGTVFETGIGTIINAVLYLADGAHKMAMCGFAHRHFIKKDSLHVPMKIKIRLLLMLVGLSHWAVAQKAQRLAVPGTHCTIIPPKGYTADPEKHGFVSLSKAASILVDEIEVSVDTIADEITAANFPKHDGVLHSSVQLDWKDKNAVLITAEQTYKGQPYSTIIIFFGNDKKSVLMAGNFPLSSPELAAEIKAAMLTLEYNDPDRKATGR